MAWELQRHMHSWVAPSIDKAARETDFPKSWLADRYADQRWDEETGNAGYDMLHERAAEMEHDTLVGAITDKAIQNSSTTNGGFEVYLDGWTSVPWCSEDEQQLWSHNFQTLRKEQT